MARRSKSVTVRLSEEEQTKLQRIARERDLPMSIVLRQILKEGSLPTHVTAEDTPPKRES